MAFKTKDTSNWSGKYPELEEFLICWVIQRVDGFGMVYLEAMNKAWHQHKEEGLSSQLRHIANNLKDAVDNGKLVNEHLIKWSEYFKDVNVNQSPSKLELS